MKKQEGGGKQSNKNDDDGQININGLLTQATDTFHSFNFHIVKFSLQFVFCFYEILNILFENNVFHFNN